MENLLFGIWESLSEESCLKTAAARGGNPAQGKKKQRGNLSDFYAVSG
ncbi:MAG: hypothetical protein IJ466_05685 [Clostridia bacterium]|nr:hypothetical protein [Clostridia bacterium]